MNLFITTHTNQIYQIYGIPFCESFHELLNHLPKPKPQEEYEAPKKIEIEKAKPKQSRRPVHTLEPQVHVENKNIEVPKSFIPQNYISPSFSIFGY